MEIHGGFLRPKIASVKLDANFCKYPLAQDINTDPDWDDSLADRRVCPMHIDHNTSISRVECRRLSIVIYNYAFGLSLFTTFVTKTGYRETQCYSKTNHMYRLDNDLMESIFPRFDNVVCRIRECFKSGFERVQSDINRSNWTRRDRLIVDLFFEKNI